MRDRGVSSCRERDAPLPPPSAAVPLPLQGRINDRTPRLTRLLALLAAAFLLRGLVLGDPVIHVDEEFYFVTARAIARGSLPYIDVWDRKPFGLFLLYLPAAALPWRWGIVAYQLMAFASALATAWLIARLADRAGWQRGATLAGIAYLVWLDLLGGVGGQSPVFYNLLVVGGATLALRPGLLRAAAAMALIGLALQIKYSALFEGIALGLWLLWLNWRSLPASAAHAALLIALALAPTVAAWGFYAAHGHADAFNYANFTSIFARHPDPWPEQLGNAATLLLILSPLIAMAFGATRDADAPLVRRFLRGWFGVALVAVALFGSWFDHYGLPVLVPACACAAGFFANSRWRRLTPAVLALAAIIGLARVVIDREHRGNGVQLAALARAIGRGPGCLFVYSGSTMLYPATGRCAASTYIFPSHLSRSREARAIGVDQAAEVRRILATRPAAIVMRPPYRGERPAIRALVTAEVHNSYRLAARLPMGRETLEVWRR